MEELEEDQPLSKTKKKHNMHALQALGTSLVLLSTEQLKRVPLPESLLDAVHEAQRMTKFEARRRQLQYIGKLMRHVDAEPIQESVAALNGQSQTENAFQHRIEALRTRFLEDEKTLTNIAETFPKADLQHLRVLRRNALKERELGKPPKSFRELFRALKAIADEERKAVYTNGNSSSTP